MTIAAEWNNLPVEFDGSDLAGDLNLHDAVLLAADRGQGGNLELTFKVSPGYVFIKVNADTEPMLWSSGFFLPCVISAAAANTLSGWRQSGISTLLDEPYSGKLLEDARSYAGEDCWIVVFTPAYGHGFALVGRTIQGSPFQVAHCTSGNS